MSGTTIVVELSRQEVADLADILDEYLETHYRYPKTKRMESVHKRLHTMMGTST